MRLGASRRARVVVHVFQLKFHRHRRRSESQNFVSLSQVFGDVFHELQGFFVFAKYANTCTILARSAAILHYSLCMSHAHAHTKYNTCISKQHAAASGFCGVEFFRPQFIAIFRTSDLACNISRGLFASVKRPPISPGNTVPGITKMGTV